MASELVLLVVVFIAIISTARAALLSHTVMHRAIAHITVPLLLSLGIENFATNKQINLSDAAMAKIIANDITSNQALATADFDRSIYSEDCTFQDEIDTYSIDNYVKGTKALFNKERSKVELVGEVQISAEEAVFKFKEDLSFNVPLKPIVTLSGKVVLTRGEGGLIVKSREYWDQKPFDVLKTARLN